MVNVLMLLALVFFSSLLFTALLRRYALARNVLDIPNARSSHQQPTPRGGGVAIVLSLLTALPVLAVFELFSPMQAMLLASAGLLIAVVGFIDDHQHIPAGWRLLWHFSAASLVVWACDGLPALTFFGHSVDLGLFGDVLTVVAVVWLINLTNFMDGIDGIASVQAISLALALSLLPWLLTDSAVAPLPLLMAGAVAGFLYWNYPPARIFMGDAGSGFLGLMMAALILLAAQQDPRWFWSGVLLYACFIVDATYTLVIRLSRGKKLYEAHRSHAYQIASRRFGSHKPVTLYLLGFNLLILWPLAYAVGAGALDGALAVLMVYLPLVVLVRYLRAGQDD